MVLFSKSGYVKVKIPVANQPYDGWYMMVDDLVQGDNHWLATDFFTMVASLHHYGFISKISWLCQGENFSGSSQMRSTSVNVDNNQLERDNDKLIVDDNQLMMDDSNLITDNNQLSAILDMAAAAKSWKSHGGIGDCWWMIPDTP